MPNFICEFKNALSPEYCQALIKKFEADSRKQAGRTGAGVDKSKKDSQDLYISSLAEWKPECNEIANTVLRATMEYVRQFPFLLTGAVSMGIQDPKTKQTRTIRYEDVAQINDTQLQGLVTSLYRPDDVNLQKYTKGKGGYHHWHSEHYPHPKDPQQRSLHRVLLWLIYLNDIQEGGETEFFYQNAKVRPTQGSLVMAPCTFTHTHRGHIPISSDKYVLASWVMYNPAAQLYGQHG